LLKLAAGSWPVNGFAFVGMVKGSLILNSFYAANQSEESRRSA
jgi:hypothetical protein